MAAASSIIMQIDLEDGPVATAEKCIDHVENGRIGLAKLANLLNAIASGSVVGKVLVHATGVNGAAATDSIVITYANVTDGDGISICGHTVVAKTTITSTNPYDGQFLKQTDATVTGDNLAAAISAHPVLKHIMTATNSAGTVTCTMKFKGPIGNTGFMLSSDATAFTVEAAFAGGTRSSTAWTAYHRCYRGGLA